MIHVYAILILALLGYLIFVLSLFAQNVLNFIKCFVQVWTFYRKNIAVVRGETVTDKPV